MKNLLLALLLACPLLLAAQSEESKQLYQEYLKQNAAFKKNQGKPYPAFSVRALDGTKISQKDLLGKVTWINLWYYHCPPCKAQLDILDSLYTQFKNNPDFRFISFTLDGPIDARKAIRELGLSFPVCSIPLEEGKYFTLGASYPVNFITDRDGNIACLKSGGRMTKEDILEDLQTHIEKVKELLSSRPSSGISD